MKLTEYGIWTFVRYESNDIDLEDTEYIGGKVHEGAILNSRRVKSGIVIEDNKYLEHWGHPSLLDMVSLGVPGAKIGLAEAMALPIRRKLDYQSIARKIFAVDPLPDGALPVYKKDDE